METLQGRASRRLDAIFRTGYPHPINIFAALMLALLPLLSLLSGEGAAFGRPPWAHGLAIGLGLGYLLIWSRVRPNDSRWVRGIYHELYLLGQTVLVAAIYALDGGLTRFLFVVIAVQAVYLIPARRWGPFLGTLAALWLTLFLAITPPGEPGGSLVTTIGMYLLYLIFAALVTFTTLQQERQGRLAQKLLEGVDQRHQALRAYDLTVEQRTETEERERLSRTIHGRLVAQLSALRERLAGLVDGGCAVDAPTITREAARAARLEAKAVLAEVRAAVRALRPGEEGADLGDEDEPGRFDAPPEPDFALKVTDPINVYHIWNLGVIGVTTGVMLAAMLLAGNPVWPWVVVLGLALVGAYAGTAWVGPYTVRAFFVVVQAALILVLVRQTEEPLLNHLFLVVSAQMVFLVPPSVRGVVAAVAFPTVLTGLALWWPMEGLTRGGFPLSVTTAFGVTYFFAAVMAFMTRRQVAAREQAIQYAHQLNEVNRLLEARLIEARQVAIARERVRMAREIHDGLGHHLTAVIMELQYAESLADEEPDAACNHVRSGLAIIGAAMKAGQEMVQTLERFDRPLPEAIHDLASRWMKATGTPVFLRIDGDCAHLSTGARITLFRAVQESLTNIQKHARASRVEIRLTHQRDRISLMVSNDDQGGMVADEAVRSGFGLVGLRERAESLMGEFRAEPRPDGGFTVSLVLPLGA